MVRPEGLEPPTNGLGNRCSILLSYGRLTCVAHQIKMARPAGFEPATTGFVVRYSIQLSYGRSFNGGESGIRTHDTGFSPYNRLAGDRLRPTRPSLRGYLFVGLAEEVGFEPTEPEGSTVFKTASLNRSDTPPRSTAASNVHNEV